MIITAKKQIPIRWICFAILPWAAIAYTGGAGGVAFFFSLKKFVENPVGLTFVLSLPTFISIFTGPCTSFMSDRIWTRFGRRKPFIITSWVGMSCCLVLMPLMTNFWALLVTYMVYSLFSDLNSPIDPLQQEITPPQERGRSTGAMQWCWNLANITFYLIALGRFDDVTYIDGFPISGEAVIYWSAAMLLSVMLLLIMLGIKEIDQKSSLRGQRFSLNNFFRGIFDRELWPVYMLVFGSAALASGLGPLGNLLYTDQWSYTKQDMGINMAAGGVINVFIIGFLTVFADKLNRMRAYQTLIVMSFLLNIAYFCYVTFVLPDQRPSLLEIIVFGETGSILGLLTGMVYFPLVYDYITRNKLGTYVAGANLVTRITGFITLNGVGLFIWGYAALFQPPAGEMIRIVFKEEQNNKANLLSPLRSELPLLSSYALPCDASNLTAFTWQANGVVSPSGKCWEFRLRDKTSEDLAANREDFIRQQFPLLTDVKDIQDQILVLKRQGKDTITSGLEERQARGKREVDDFQRKVDAIDKTLADRANYFESAVTRLLSSRLIADGDQILGASITDALVVNMITSKRPDAHETEVLISKLRQECPDFIDARPLKLLSGYGIAFSRRITDPSGEAIAVSQLQAAVLRISSVSTLGLKFIDQDKPEVNSCTALQLDLAVVEEPIDTYVSPINSFFNLVAGSFTSIRAPDHRLVAIAQNLRSTTDIDHISIRPGNGSRSISVLVLLPQSPTLSDLSKDLISQKLKNLLINQPGLKLERVRRIYDSIERSAATQQITVARPVIVSSYAPMKYNYMSGYLWMFIMGIIGIAITLFFNRLEKKGFICKLGVEEAEAS